MQLSADGGISDLWHWRTIASVFLHCRAIVWACPVFQKKQVGLFTSISESRNRFRSASPSFFALALGGFSLLSLTLVPHLNVSGCSLTSFARIPRPACQVRLLFSHKRNTIFYFLYNEMVFSPPCPLWAQIGVSCPFGVLGRCVFVIPAKAGIYRTALFLNSSKVCDLITLIAMIN